MNIREGYSGKNASAVAGAAYQSGGKVTSSLRAAAYQSGEKLDDYQNGETYQYGRSERVAAEGIMLPDYLSDEGKEYFSDRERLWNIVEDREAQEGIKNPHTYTRLEAALPRELNQEQALQLIHDYCETFTKQGLVADWALHVDGGSYEASNNPHAHVLFTVRPLSSSFDIKDPRKAFESFKTNKTYLCQNEAGERKEIPCQRWAAEKDTWRKLYNYADPKKIVYKDAEVIDWKQTPYIRLTKEEGDKRGWVQRSRFPVTVSHDAWHAGLSPKEALKAQRQEWEKCVNEALKAAGKSERIDARSYAERGIDRIPTIHVGNKAHHGAPQGNSNNLYQVKANALGNKDIAISSSVPDSSAVDPPSASGDENIVISASSRASLNQLISQTNAILAQVQRLGWKAHASSGGAADQGTQQIVSLLRMIAGGVITVSQLRSYPPLIIESKAQTSTPITKPHEERFPERDRPLESQLEPINKGTPSQIFYAEEVRARALQNIPQPIKEDVNIKPRILEAANNRDAAFWISRKAFITDWIKSRAIAKPLESGRGSFVDFFNNKKTPMRAISEKQAVLGEHFRGLGAKFVAKNAPTELLRDQTFSAELKRVFTSHDATYWLANKNSPDMGVLKDIQPVLDVELISACSVETREKLENKEYKSHGRKIKVKDGKVHIEQREEYRPQKKSGNTNNNKWKTRVSDGDAKAKEYNERKRAAEKPITARESAGRE